MTFRELYEERRKILQKQAIYKHLVDYLDEFIQTDYRPAQKNIILEEDKYVEECFILDVKKTLEDVTEECNTKLQEIDEKHVQ